MRLVPELVCNTSSLVLVLVFSLVFYKRQEEGTRGEGEEEALQVRSTRPLSVPFLLRISGKGTDVATPLWLEKCERIDFALKKWTNRVQKTAKSRRTHAKEPWELVRLCFRSLFRP